MTQVKFGALCLNQHTDWPSLLEAGRRADRLDSEHLSRATAASARYLLAVVRC
jgi:hypothetical protein